MLENGSNSGMEGESMDGFPSSSQGSANQQSPTPARVVAASPRSAKRSGGGANTPGKSTDGTTSASSASRKRKQTEPRKIATPSSAAAGTSSTSTGPATKVQRKEDASSAATAAAVALAAATAGGGDSMPGRTPAPSRPPSTGGGGQSSMTQFLGGNASASKGKKPSTGGGGGGVAVARPPASSSASPTAPFKRGDQNSPELAKLQMSLELKEKRIFELQNELDKERTTSTEGYEGYKVALRSILRTQVLAEKHNSRTNYLKNIQRLGWVQSVRHGVNSYGEQWNDGAAFSDLDQRTQAIESNIVHVEADIKVLKREKDKRTKEQKKAESTNSNGGGSASNSGNGFATPAKPGQYDVGLEIATLNKERLQSERKAITLEKRLLTNDKLLHIREGKRLNDEGGSNYKMGEQSLKEGRYLIMSLLGRGGFSEVFKAYDLDECRLVACKIHRVATDWSESKKENYIKHASREYEIHVSLKHANIAELYDVFEIDDDSFCTVLEYCVGNDLDLLIKQSHFLAEKDAKSKIVQVVAALKYLNEQEKPIIHYDLKPANVLLVDGKVKLTDFGLSKKMTESDDSGNMELTSQGAGTYWYLPPETFRISASGPPKISSKVDVWSVGVLFYQCLYGKKPFGNDQSQQSILQNQTILNAKPVNFPEPTKDNGYQKVSKQAQEFIRRCLTIEMHDRPDVLELAKDAYICYSK
jgi:tousled-like kinase